MFVVPRKAPPSMLAFMEPFAYDLWAMILVCKDTIYIIYLYVIFEKLFLHNLIMTTNSADYSTDKSKLICFRFNRCLPCILCVGPIEPV